MTNTELGKFIESQDEYKDLVFGDEMLSTLPLPRMKAYNETNI